MPKVFDKLEILEKLEVALVYLEDGAINSARARIEEAINLLNGLEK